MLFNRPMPPRFDLMGRQPSASRKTLVMMWILVLLSVASVLACLFWQHRVVRKDFVTAFGTSLYMQAKPTTIPLQIELSRLAVQIEDSLYDLATKIRDDYLLEVTGIGNPERTRMWTGMEELEKSTRVAFLSNAAYLDALREDDSIDPMPIHRRTFGEDSIFLSYVSRFQIAPQWTRSLSGLSGDVNCQSRLCSLSTFIGKRIGHSFRKFCSAATLDSTKGLLFVYCAIAAPVSFLDSATYAADVRDWLHHRTSERDRALRRSRFGGAREAEEGNGPHYSDTTPYIFLVYPSSGLPADYDCTSRDWFRQALNSDKVVWSRSYPDAGTGLQVVTASYVIRSSPNGPPIGVVAVDLHADYLAQLPSRGYAYLVNFCIVLIFLVLLLAIVAASGRRRFDPLLFAFTVLLIYYVSRIVFWAFIPQVSDWSYLVRYLDVMLSILTSLSFLAAGVLVYQHFKYPNAAPKSDYDLSDSFNRAMDKLIGGLQFKEIHISNVIMVVFSFLLAIATALFDALFSKLINVEMGKILEWIDAALSAGALMLFGYYFAGWVHVFFRTWLTVVAFAAFMAFAIVQLPFPIQEPTSSYWLILAAAKSIPLFLVVLTTYLWTQLASFERIRGTGSRATILDRLAAPRNFVFIAGILDQDRILFVDSSTLCMLNYAPEPPHNPYQPYNANPKIEGWVISDFGDGLYRPEPECFGLADLFENGDYARLKSKIQDVRVNETVKKLLDDRLTSRHTRLKMLHNLDCYRLHKKGLRENVENGEAATAVPVRIVSLTAWQDVDCKVQRMAGQASQTEISPWYVVILCEKVN